MEPLNLHQAILKSDFSLARRLIESGTTVNSRDEEGRTPLMLCCLHDGETWSVGVARMLLIHGGRVGHCDRRGRTALMYAVRYERLGLVGLFLQALDYDLNHVDKRGHMALWYAARVGNGQIYDRLLKAMKTCGLSSDASAAAAPRLCGHNKQDQVLVKHQRAVERNGIISAADHKVTGHTKPRPGNNLRLLFQKEFPYKPIPAHCWTKRENLHKTVKQPQVKPETKKPLSKRCKEAKTTTSTSTEWKVDLMILTEALLRQLSLSYRPGAQPRPPSTTWPCRRTRRLGASPSAETHLRERWRRGRKMSLDAISDSPLKEVATVGAFRRRCSLSVIPVIRLRAGLANHRSNTSGLKDTGEGRVSHKTTG